MEKKIIKANALLFLAALVWGSTFVAQRVGMDHMGPFFFSGSRFALGAVFLLPLTWWGHRRRPSTGPGPYGTWLPLWGSVLAGTALFAGINLQQVGLVYTTAGKAAFITGLYVIIVPILGLYWGQRPGLGLWIGAPLGAAGLYFLSVKASFELAPGDGWILLCAVVWAIHVLILGWLSPRMSSFVLAFGQSAVCAVLSLLTAWCVEDVTLPRLSEGAIPVIYGGIMSVALGFTLQVIAQKDSPPAHAAVILQLEAVVGAVSGWLFLGEVMGPRAIAGASMMLAGMLIAQLWPLSRRRAYPLPGSSAV